MDSLFSHKKRSPALSQKDKEMDKEKEFNRKMNILIESVDKVYPSLPQVMLRSFIQGIFFALGSTIGLALVISIITYAVSQLKTIPGFPTIIDTSQLNKMLK